MGVTSLPCETPAWRFLPRGGQLTRRPSAAPSRFVCVRPLSHERAHVAPVGLVFGPGRPGVNAPASVGTREPLSIVLRLDVRDLEKVDIEHVGQAQHVGSDVGEFVIDAYARRLICWRVTSHLRTDVVLNALEQAVHDRRPDEGTGLVRHCDRGGQGGSGRWSLHRAARRGRHRTLRRIRR